MKRILENENLIFPDYKNSVLNVSAFLAEIYDVNVAAEPIRILDYESISSKKNVVVIILDGFGYNLLEKYYNGKLPFFKEVLLSKITSVFPSTTAAAITSIYSGKLPAEHGVIGWALYFKEYFKIFEYLPVKDKSTGKELSLKIYDYFKLLKPDSLIRKIANANPDLNITYITPKKLKGTPYNNIIAQGSNVKGFKKEKVMLKKISKALSNNKRNFVIAYSTNPDSLEHVHGTRSKVIEKFLTDLDKDFRQFYANLPKDTSVIITADHGLTDLDKFYIINEDRDLYNSLILPPFPESRFVSFFVKPHKEKIFKNAFFKYENDFILFDREEFITFGFLGDADYHYKIDDFLGNYIAIAIGNKGFRYLYRQKEDKNITFKAHHSGITKDEMEVPLFYFEK